MSTLFDKARKMMSNNRKKRSQRRLLGVVGVVLAIVVSGLLVGKATALVGGDTLRNSITADSALFWEPADGDETAWQKVDPNTPVDATSKLRLRLAFYMDASNLQNGTTFEYQLPQGINLPDTEDGQAILVFDGQSAEVASENDVQTIGTGSIKDGVLSLNLAGVDTNSTVAGYIDLDCAFDQLNLDEDGAVTLELNDNVRCAVVRSSIQSEVSDSASPQVAEAPTDESAADSTDIAMPAESNTVETNALASVAEGQGQGVAALVAANSAPTVSTQATTVVNGNDHLQSVTISTKNGSNWESIDPKTKTLEDGDPVRVDLNFHFDSNEINADHKTVEYQLPNGVSPKEAITGQTLYQNNIAVGTFDVDTNGKVTLHFNSDYATGAAINANVWFEGTVSSSGASSDGKISFNDKNNTQITVKPKETPDGHDVSIAKNGELTKGSNGEVNGAKYTLTVTTQNGTDGTVDVMDNFGWGNNVEYSNGQNEKKNQFYDQSSLSVVKKTSSTDNGQVVDSSNYTVVWTTTTDGSQWGNPRFVVRGLPALKAGESYEVRYAAKFKSSDVNTDSTINNSATAYTPKHRADTGKTLEWKTDDTKSGSLDSDGKTITWTITINRNSKNLKDMTLIDNPPNDITGAIEIKNSNGQAAMTLNKENSYYVYTSTGSTATYAPTKNPQLTVHFSSTTDDYGTYTITYKTKVPSGTGTEKISNTVNTHYADGTNHSSTGTVDVTHNNEWGIQKTTQQNIANGKNSGFQGKGLYRQAWASTVTMPEGAVSSFTIHDEIGGLTAQDGTTVDGSGHYAIAKELYEELCQYGIRITLNDDASTLLDSSYAISDPITFIKEPNYEATDAVTATVVMKDAKGNVVNNNSDAHVKSFDVTITPKNSGTISGKSVLLWYSTLIDTSAAPDGSVVKAENKSSVNEKNTTATTEVRKSESFKKQILQRTTSDSAKIWSSATKKQEYNKQDSTANKVTYRILVDTTEASGDIVIKDELPAGMTITGTPMFGYWGNDASSENDDWGGKLSWNQKGQTVTFTIANGYTQPAQAYIRYDATFADDDAWKSDDTKDKTYTNIATWGNKQSSSSVDIHRTPDYLTKSGAQELDANGNPTGTVNYSVVINPQAEDLNPASDYLDLSDVLTADAALQPELDIQNVKLYAYSSTATDHRGDEIDDSTYTVSYDAKSHTLKARIPDGKACVLVYMYELKGFNNLADSVSVSNSVSLNGQWSKSTSTSIKNSTAGGGATKGEFFFYKVDSEDYKNQLSGAKFDLYSGEDGGHFSKQLGDIEIDKKKEWDLLDTSQPNQAIFKHDVLYKFEETQAPDGYQKSDEPVYVVWLNNGEKENDAWNKISSSGILNEAKKANGNQIGQDDIHFIPNTGGSLYVTNEYTLLTVKKAWTASDGSALADSSIPVDSIQAKLYQDTVSQDGWTVTVTGTAYGAPYTSSALVKKGSKITVSTKSMWGAAGAQMQISLNGGNSWENMKYDSTKLQWWYTIASVTSDMPGIQVRSENGTDWVISNNGGGFVFSDYEEPEKDVHSKVYQAVTLRKDEGWSYTWDSLPKQDENGNECTYHIEEASDVPGFTMSYLNNDGVNTGTITITNQKILELPKTGGPGTVRYLVTGAAIAVAAAAALLVRRKRLS